MQYEMYFIKNIQIITIVSNMLIYSLKKYFDIIQDVRISEL